MTRDYLSIIAIVVLGFLAFMAMLPLIAYGSLYAVSYMIYHIDI